MKILLAAGVFYPDVGGPAIHVQKIAERLAAGGLRVQVVAYGDDPSNTQFKFKVTRISRKLPKNIQWFFYLALVIWHSSFSKIVYAFDPTAAGVPARIATSIFHKPFLIRVGGDPIWEREAEMGRRFLPLEKYYEQGLYLKDKPILYNIIRWVLKGSCRMVVYNQNFKNFYAKYFDVPAEKITVIKNPVFKREQGSNILPEDPIILFAGRFVAYKNLPLVIKAVENVGKGKLVLIGSGPEKDKLHGSRVAILKSLSQEKLFEHIKQSAICIGPALSEFNPNFILEALSFGKPVLLSRGHGLSVELPEEFLFDPMDQRELERKLHYILQPENYERAVNMVNNLPLRQSWEDVTSAHLDIIETCIK